MFEMTRDALLFSDGSIQVYAEGWPMAEIEGDRADADKGVTDRATMTKIARLEITILETLFDPATAAPGAALCGGCKQECLPDLTYCPACGAQNRMKPRTRAA